MKMTATDLSIGRIEAGVGHGATVNRVEIGAASIGKLTIRRLELGFPKVQASLRGVRVSVEVRPSFDWKIKVGGLERSGSSSPASLSMDVLDSAVHFALPHGMGGVTVAEMSVPDLVLGSAKIGGTSPSETLDLGQIVVEAMNAAQVTTADGAPPPAPPDVQVGAIRLEELGLAPGHSAVLRETTAKQVRVGGVPIPTLTVGEIKLPPIVGLPVTSEKVVVEGPVVKKTIGDDDGVLRWHLGLEMVARLTIDELVLTLDTSISVGGIDLSEIRLPITLGGLSVGATEIHDATLSCVVIEPEAP